jgi:hypothetical protein
MTNAPSIYGFRYRWGGRNWALDIPADSAGQARARLAAMAQAEFISELAESQVAPQKSSTNESGLSTP